MEIYSIIKTLNVNYTLMNETSGWEHPPAFPHYHHDNARKHVNTMTEKKQEGRETRQDEK